VSLCTFVIINTFKKTKIDKVLETSSYSYLPKEAKNFIKEVYEETGEVILTEKNKKSNAPYLNSQYVSYLALSDEEKMILLQKQIDEIVGTFYRQALFAHYELEVSRLIENNQPLNHEVLSSIMVKLYKDYYDMDIEKEEVKKYVWAYIPHLFYTPFYVYQYATSFAASFALYENVKRDGLPAFENYVNLLRSGGSKYPIIQTKEAGIDLTKKETFMSVVHRLDELVAQLEKLTK
jgi:oligoendopeptidase F